MVKDILDKFNELLKKFLPKLLISIQIDHGVGSAVSITNAKIDGKKTKMNPLEMSKKDQKKNISMIESLINDVNTEVAKKINYQVNKSALEGWDSRMLAKELRELDLEETYKNRFKTISETESNRIMNNSSFNTANRLGAKKKYLFNLMDGKTGEDSKVAQRKYGDEDQAIQIDEPFKYKFNGKVREFMFPPDRPRDRSLIMFTFE